MQLPAQGPLGRWFNLTRIVFVPTTPTLPMSINRPLSSSIRRETYRYTLLAILLAPKKWLHKSFGAVIFNLGSWVYRECGPISHDRAIVAAAMLLLT
jgi:hypothetical protein